MATRKQKNNAFEEHYPFLHLYVSYHGWMEIGSDGNSSSWLRILDEGGTQLEVDEGGLDDSLTIGEEWAEEWMRDNYEREVEKAGL